MLIYYDKKNNKIMRIKPLKVAFRLTVFFIIVFVVWLIINIIKYPELYDSISRYQLHNDIIRGNTEAVEYYNRVYKNNGINLFDWFIASRINSRIIKWFTKKEKKTCWIIIRQWKK